MYRPFHQFRFDVEQELTQRPYSWPLFLAVELVNKFRVEASDFWANGASPSDVAYFIHDMQMTPAPVSTPTRADLERVGCTFTTVRR